MRIIVVGGGIYGITTALELQKRGHQVIVIERDPIPHSEAASTDISKLVRLDYGDDVVYTEMMEDAMARWVKFNKEMANGEEIYHNDGILALTYTDPADDSFFKSSRDLLRKRGHQIEDLSRTDIKERFPMWNSALFHSGYWNPQGGWVESGKCTAAYATLAIKAGVKIVRDSMASLIFDKPGGSAVSGVLGASKTRYEGDRVLVAAGAWTPILLPHLSHVMWPTGQIVHHFQPAKEDVKNWLPPTFPPYLTVGETGFYGFPAHYTSDGRVKIGHHGKGVPLKSLSTQSLKEALDANLSASEAAFRRFIADHFPKLNIAPKVFSRICLYCDSYDGDFWIDKDRKFENLYVAAGDSGHGFKFATILGDLIADVLEDKPNKYRSKFAWREPSAKSAIEQRRTILSAEDDVKIVPVSKL